MEDAVIEGLPENVSEKLLESLPKVEEDRPIPLVIFNAPPPLPSHPPPLPFSNLRRRIWSSKQEEERPKEEKEKKEIPKWRKTLDLILFVIKNPFSWDLLIKQKREDSVYETHEFFSLKKETRRKLFFYGKRLVLGVAALLFLYFLYALDRNFIHTSHWYQPSHSSNGNEKQWSSVKIPFDKVRKLSFSSWKSYYGENPYCKPLERPSADEAAHLIGSLRIEEVVIFENETLGAIISIQHLHELLLYFTSTYGVEFATPRMFLNMTSNTSMAPCICSINEGNKTEMMINPVITHRQDTSKNKVTYSSDIILSDKNDLVASIPASITVVYETMEQYLSGDGLVKKKVLHGIDVAKLVYCLLYMSRPVENKS